MHLEPLAIASNIIQSAFCRLDEVLLTFAMLYLHFANLTSSTDTDICSAVLRSIETRWSKCDQEVFIAAVILNPLMPPDIFSQIPQLNQAGIITLFTHLYRRFFRTPVRGSELLSNVRDYYSGTGIFNNMRKLRTDHIVQAHEQVCAFSPCSSCI
jgi:hypothetical protein